MNFAFRALLQPAALLIYLAAFAIGALYAQILPTLSVYMVHRFPYSCIKEWQEIGLSLHM